MHRSSTGSGRTGLTSSTFFGAGKVGVVTTVANTTFDDFTYLRATPHDPACPGWNTTADVTLDTGNGKLTVTGNTYGGAAVSQWAGDDDYVAEADIDLNSGALAHLIVRYMDPDNWMAAEIRANGTVRLVKCLDGRETNVASDTYTPAGTVNVRIKASGTTYTIWVAGVQEINTTDGDIPWGTVALSGRSPKFSNVKVGYDNNSYPSGEPRGWTGRCGTGPKEGDDEESAGAVRQRWGRPGRRPSGPGEALRSEGSA